jgi:membrane protease YdiL (CAAX protease family)
MRTVWILSAVAGGLWFVMFSPWTRDVVPFWPAMAFSSGLLALTGLWLNRKSLGEVFAFRWWHVPVGLVSALVLYLMFFVGHKIATAILPFASDQVSLVYRTRSQADLWVIGILLFAWVGPAEEIFWRGYVQRRFGQCHSPFAGLVVTATIYTLVHIWSFNLMLLAAAGLCGVFWGAMFWRFRSVWPALVSHAVWDVAIFVLLPIH